MKQHWKLDELAVWLSQKAMPEVPSPTQPYRHQLLKENFELRPQISEKLRALIWRAHEDARLYRQGESADFSIPRKASSVPDNPVEWQPELLPLKTQKEYFGEIFAGLVVENFAPFGIEDWVVPAFFFRSHNTAYHRLEQISITGEKAKDVPGVLGNDGLAFQLGADGYIKRSIVYEAKCTATKSHNLIVKAHKQLSDLRQIPESIWQVVEILRDRKYDDVMLDALVFLGTRGADRNYERCDLIVYVYGQLPKRDPTWIDPNKPRSDYTANRRLEAVEVYIKGVCEDPDRNLLDELVLEVHREIQVDEMECIEAQETAQISDQVKDLIQRLLEERAESFPPRYAKLYSQHKRLRAGQQGLVSWRPNEASDRLSEAVQLLESAFIAREVNKDNWQKGMQRAGAILEWLAHPELNLSILPLQLLSAATYQLAGYPACALGLLKQEPIDKSESRILRALLEADFPKLLRRLTEYWATKVSSTGQDLTKSPEANLENFKERVVGETTQALGVLCAEMRWGDEERLSQAIDKLFRVSKMMLHGRDVYSWLLSKLCAEVVTVYAQSSFRSHLPSIASELNYFGEKALENYLRLRYQQKKALAWPSQVRGIERLKLENSFALCTPTGSGKTTVAEVAILQSLFKKQIVDEDAWIPPKTPAPLAIYLTPTRALSAEVESTLSRALGNLGSKKVVVTGLYGGTDWGPTDVWLTETNPTVLICTYEKAEALMRFLGSWLFRDRISLVIIDEAHRVNFDQNWSKLQEAENRTLRLESIGTRILTYLDETESRIMALSAVASGMDDALAQWVSNEVAATPERAFYRSTRQLIGRLECLPGGRFKIFYDLLDGDDLEFEKGADGKPFVPNLLPALPPTTSDWSGAQKQFRPYLFWAAMHLAQRDERGQHHAVLISVTQKIGGYAKDFLTLLESDWEKVEKPDFFVPPDASSPEYGVWQDCLKACGDYFTDQSREYLLLQHGVVVHHGKMPGPLARLLVEVIEARIVHLVLATSTLSEGVNLPFETVLIPNLRRYDEGKGHWVRLSPQEFSNLVGRAGRPGFSTEGQSLILVGFWDAKQKRDYSSLLDEVLSKRELNEAGLAQSPLAELIARIEQLWREISGSTDDEDFQHWLEITAPLTEEKTDLVEFLDTLDSILLSAIVELEQIAHEELSADEMEERLRQIWQHSYARYASQEESCLEALFIRRGRALKEQIYTDAAQRKRLYRTSLPPRSGDQLLNLYPAVIEHLKTGEDYLKWAKLDRFDYIKNTIELLNTLPKFELERTEKYSWEDILWWWFRMWFGRKPIQPSVAQISKWHQYVSRNFGYRFNWGLGSVISLAAEEAFGDLPPTLDDWPRTGLPWAAFWMKELIIWGTLDPVAAYLLARRVEVTRDEAEARAREYYDRQPELQDPDEVLNAMEIQRWAAELPSRDETPLMPDPPASIQVQRLLGDFSQTLQEKWRVVPVETKSQIYWFDPAGVALAVSGKNERWLSEFLDTHDFILNVSQKEVSWELYSRLLSPF